MKAAHKSTEKAWQETKTRKKKLDNPNYGNIASTLSKLGNLNWIKGPENIKDVDQNKELPQIRSTRRGGIQTLGNPNFGGISIDDSSEYNLFNPPPPRPRSGRTMEPSDEEMNLDLLEKIVAVEAEKVQTIHSRETEAEQVESHTEEYMTRLGARQGNLKLNHNEIFLIVEGTLGQLNRQKVQFKHEGDHLFHTILELDDRENTILDLKYIVRRSGKMVAAHKASFYISPIRVVLGSRPNGRVVAAASYLGAIYADDQVDRAAVEEALEL